jgi:hypothetical protein
LSPIFWTKIAARACLAIWVVTTETHELGKETVALYLYQIHPMTSLKRTTSGGS